MVHTRNQPSGDLSPAVSGHSTNTTGGLLPATYYSAVTSSVTAAGDSITTNSKTATGGLLSSWPGGTFAVTSPPSGNGHFSASANATTRTRVASSDVGTSPFGQTALDSASANLVSSHDREPSVTGPGRFFRAGAYFGPSDRCRHRCDPTTWATMVECTLGMSPRTPETRQTCLGLRPPCISLRLPESRRRACKMG